MTEEWISVQEYAQRIGKSRQTVYNKIKAGTIEWIKFKRGKMNGYLIKSQKNESELRKEFEKSL